MQCSGTNQNIKILVTAYKRIVKSIVSRVDVSSESNMFLSDKERYTLESLLCGISAVDQL